MATLKRSNLPALTGLRFLLALLIVFHHQAGPEGCCNSAPVPYLHGWRTCLHRDTRRWGSSSCSRGFCWPTALIAGLGLGGGVVPRVLSTRTMLLLGQSSYALYLVHGPLKSIWLAAGARWGLPILGYGWFALYALAAVAASLGVFLGVEEPMRRLILRRFGTPEEAGSSK